MGWVLYLNFQNGRGRAPMIYTISLKFEFQSAKSNFCETRSERRSRERGSGDGAPIRGCWGAEPPKIMALAVCSMKTDADVY